MPYVQRDSSGAVVGRYANAQPGYAEEFLAEGHPDLAPTLREIATAKRSQIETAYNVAVSFLKDYPQSEQMSWAAQEAEARAFTANNAAVTPTLSAIATRTVETIAILAAKVIANADAFKAGGGDAIGRRRSRMKAIAAAVAANDTAALQAVVW